MNSKAGHDSVPRYLVFVFLLFAIGISGAGYLYYEAQTRSIKRDRQADLSAIADLKVKGILDWRTQRSADAGVIFENPIVARRVRSFLETPDSPSQLKKELVDWMVSMQEHYEYESIFLLDRKGEVRLAVDPKRKQIGKGVQTLARDAMRAKKVVFSDLRRDEVTDGIDLDIFVPLLVHQEGGTLCIGACVLRIDPYHFLYPLIQSWPTPSRTSETLLIRREGSEVLFLNELRHAKNTALSFRLPLNDERLPAALAVQGKEGVVEGNDYRGVPVLAALRGIPDSPWFLVAKVDLDEVYGPIHERARLVIVLVLILIALTGGTVVVLLREQRLRYSRDQYKAELERHALVQHYEFLTQYANDIIVLIDETGRVVEANDRAVAAYGYPREELIGHDMRTLRSPMVEQSLETQMMQVKEHNGMVYESLHQRKDGSVFPVEASSRVIEVEGRKFFQSIMRDITERKETEKEIRILAQAVRNTSECVLISDLEDNFLFVNEAFTKTYGYDKDELIGKNVRIIRSEKNAPGLVEQILPATLRGGWQGELLNRKKDGTEFSILLSTSVVRDENGKPIALIGVAQDITERKQSEVQLRQSEERFRTLFMSMSDGFYLSETIYDDNGNPCDYRYLEANPAFERMMGLNRDQIVGKQYKELVPVDTTHWLDTYLKVARTGLPLSYEFYSNEYQMYFETYSYQAVKGQVTVFVRDVTERKRAEEALRYERNLLRTLINNLPDGIYVKDSACRKTVANLADARNMGRQSEAEVLGKDDFDLYPKDMAERFFADDQSVIQTGQPVLDREEYVLNAEGQKRWLLTSKLPLRNDKGQIIGLVGIGRDITKRKQAEQALRYSEAQLSNAMKIAQLAPWEYDVASDLFTFNDHFYAIFRTTAEQVGGYTMSSTCYAQRFVHPDDALLVAAEIRKALETADPHFSCQLEHRIIYADGEIGHITVRFFVVKDDLGRTVKTYGVNQDITERKRAEEALRHEKALLDALMDNIPDSIYFKDRQCRLVRLNRKMMQSLKLDEMSKAIGKTDVELYGEEFGQKTFAEDRHLMTSGEPIVGLVETRQIEDGQINWTSTTKVPLRDDRGEIVGLVGITREINELMRVQDVLSQERNLLRALIDNLPDQVFVKDRESRFLVCNVGVARRAGARRPEELLEKTDFDFLPQEAAAEFYAQEQKIMESGDPIVEQEAVFIEEGGAKTWFTSTKIPLLDSQGKVIGLVGVNRDITERKHAEERLQLSDQILQRVNALVLVGDSNGETTYVSPSVKRILGYDPAEILGNGWWRVSQDDEEERKRQKDLVARGARGDIPLSPTPYERVVKSRDGVPHHILWQDAMGPENSVIGVGHDISERKLLEEQLRQAQKLESLGTLAGGIAHDFNNVLGIILGYTSMLEETKVDPKKSSRSIEAINKAVQRGAALVRQLLTFARKTDTLFESVRLNDVILELASMLQQTFPRTIQVSSQLEKEIPSITGDGNQLHQALLNLSVNARDAMPSGGTLTFATRAVMGVEVRRRFPEAQRERYVCISVTDTGIGMDKPLLARAFEPFFTTKEEGHGTGLGLAVVYGIVASHHGFIDVDSQVGHGTIFRLYFPIPERSIQMPLIATEESQAQVAGGTETLLVVEDEEMMLDLLKNILAGKGYRVMTAKDGAEAIEMYTQHRDQIDLVLMDMGLPKLSGAEALQRLQGINPKVKVILASGYISPHIKSEVLKAGVKHFVQKPYIPQEVLRHIRKVLESDKRL
ncbi:MAG: PAS domain S-box protein [Bacteroidota bacterium]